MRCVVIGSGAFGFAIAVNLLKNGNDVTVWCSSKDKLNEIKSGKEIIPGIKIPTKMKFTDSIKDAVIDADVIYKNVNDTKLLRFISDYFSSIYIYNSFS